MIFKIEQLAICPANPAAAKKLLTEMGCGDWVEDHVVAVGTVFGAAGTNEANLSFSYDTFDGNEFEVLDYTTGDNWMLHDGRNNTVSHLGMHCSERELACWKKFFEERSIHIAQEVNTISHTNAYLVGNGRKYHYCIFNTKQILGTDIKFIVRRSQLKAENKSQTA